MITAPKAGKRGSFECVILCKINASNGHKKNREGSITYIDHMLNIYLIIAEISAE